MCVICEEKYENLKKIYCYGCPNLVTVPNIEGLEILDCSECMNLTTVANIETLQRLYCNFCYGLTELPEFPNLRALHASRCINLKKIPNLPRLEELTCQGSVNLASIDINQPLIGLNCSHNRLLFRIPECRSNYFIHHNCTWLIHGINFRDNLKCLIKIQRFIKKRKILNKFIHLMNSPATAEYYFRPDKHGGLRTIGRLYQMVAQNSRI
jgi:hypothetical protein